ncbi:glucose dehydrogenase [Pelagibaculum spongiae]|uniref:Glucose dehydrogenase n=2 Tax=Pelagibaculum spongiae TaxID=2080658 RepID=A0A2V1H2K2_9GAMM|nr:glucose dehydrogenase [Pelagibaculum spongiae]
MATESPASFSSQLLTAEQAELQVQALAFSVEQITDQLDRPWSLAELPNGQLLVSERSGQLRIVDGDKISAPIANIPPVYFAGQGGLLDVKLHPQFLRNRWVYLSFAHGTKNDNALRVIRGQLRDNQLVNQQVIFTASSKDTPVHYAGRIAFLPDNTLLVTVGEGFDYREAAQKKDSLLGKIVRVRDDGSIPENNPFVAEANSNKAIFSLGHRNPQGLVYDQQRNIIYSNEHGPAGGDEINIIQAGNNYGWPVITYGRDYSGAIISPYKEYPGMQQPFIDWTPSIAPSSLAVYYGKMFPQMNGDLLTTTLKSHELRWVKMDGNQPVQQISLLAELDERLRHVEIASDGAILLLTDSGKLLKLTAK